MAGAVTPVSAVAPSRLVNVLRLSIGASPVVFDLLIRLR